jgi:hypothetical protein
MNQTSLILQPTLPAGAYAIAVYYYDGEGVVLANTGRGPQPWVTWRFYASSPEAVSYGHYFELAESARADFAKRVGACIERWRMFV